MNSFEMFSSRKGYYTWIKNTNGFYIACNENYAEVANIDSPNEVVGKNDFEMPWSEKADYFRKGDLELINNPENGVRSFVPETEILADGTTIDILVNEYPYFKPNSSTCAGVYGFFELAKDRIIIQDKLYLQDNTNKAYKKGNKVILGNLFPNKYLTKSQYQIVRYNQHGLSSKTIGAILFRSRRTIESHIKDIKNKLEDSFNKYYPNQEFQKEDFTKLLEPTGIFDLERKVPFT